MTKVGEFVLGTSLALTFGSALFLRMARIWYRVKPTLPHGRAGAHRLKIEPWQVPVAIRVGHTATREHLQWFQAWQIPNGSLVEVLGGVMRVDGVVYKQFPGFDWRIGDATGQVLEAGSATRGAHA
jgi:hypothetical protein